MNLPTPAADAFAVHRADVGDGLHLAYVREGAGGHPLLLLHGYPETKRIWWRVIEPLAAAGFEVVVPDLRGYGDSDLSPTDTYDLHVYGQDVHTLMTRVLGHDRYAIAAGDVGGVVLLDLCCRYPDVIGQACFFNSVAPVLGDLYLEAGVSDETMGGDRTARPETDYQYWQGARPDDLAAQLPTPEARRRYVSEMYGPRFWASRGTFSPDDIDFHTEPFADLDRLRAAWSVYQLAHGRPQTEMPRMFEPVTQPTLVLYGPDDHVVRDHFVAQCEVAFPNRVGPLLVPGAGHFLQWERADVFAPTLAAFLHGTR